MPERCNFPEDSMSALCADAANTAAQRRGKNTAAQRRGKNTAAQRRGYKEAPSL